MGGFVIFRNKGLLNFTCKVFPFQGDYKRKGHSFSELALEGP